MAYCKICACGRKIVFERPLSFPPNCPDCGRQLANCPTYPEGDPRIAEQMQKKPEPVAEESTAAAPAAQYALVLPDGTRIGIPDEGGVIGRTGIGAEELAAYPSVSRQHLKISRRRGFFIIEDISRYGTLVDGHRVPKDEMFRVDVGAKITLCNVETTLTGTGEEA